MIIAGNWKMHHLRADAEAYCRALRKGLGDGWDGEPQVVIFPSFPLIPAVAQGLDGSGIAVGGQDLHPEDKGAHTGDVSGPQLADAGCTWVLCGHSERRRDHGESDELVARKATAAGRNGLAAMVCVGETRDERQAGRTFEVLERQLKAVLETVPSLGRRSGRPEQATGSDEGAHTKEPRRADRTGDLSFAVAYEPVWAIGTGETATPEIAQEAHLFLRGLLAGLAGIPGGAAAVSLLYGGSVTPDNAAGLIAQPDIDGFLVGGASLDPEKFLAIIRASG